MLTVSLIWIPTVLTILNLLKQSSKKLTATHNTWSSLVWRLKCRYWCCFFCSGKRNPQQRRQPSGRPIFLLGRREVRSNIPNHPAVNLPGILPRHLFYRWTFYVCMYSVLINQLIYFWFRHVSRVVPFFSS